MFMKLNEINIYAYEEFEVTNKFMLNFLIFTKIRIRKATLLKYIKKEGKK